jgi:redox-sensitive bicupin YhaK (pirin superfamily)
MRLLLRASAHRPVDDGVEVAASPDTPTRPDPWTWQLRLLHQDPGPGAAAAVAPLPAGTPWEAVAVDTDPAVVTPDLTVSALAGTTHVTREEADLVALVVTAGSALVEGRHALAAGDAMILTGDDPLALDATGTDATLVLVRLSSPRRAPIGWVP